MAYMNHYIIKPTKKSPESMSLTWDIRANSPEEAIVEMLKLYDENSYPDAACVYAKEDEFKPSVPLLLNWERNI